MAGQTIEVRLDTRKLDSLILALGGRAQRVVRALALDVEARAKAKAPVDTGNLRRSYHTEPDPSDPAGLTVLVGTNVGYAAFVEFGTSRMAPRPHLIPAVEEVRADMHRRAEELFR
jgi:HK97 gp10 family phage protein